MNLQFLRKTLWAPFGAATVTLTIYLAHLWYDKSTNNLLVISDERSKEEPQLEAASPKDASQDGDTNEDSVTEGDDSADESSGDNGEGQDDAGEEAEEEGTEPTQEQPQTEEQVVEEKPVAEEVEEQQEADEQPQQESVPASSSEGGVDLRLFIKTKILEINDHHGEWTSRPNSLNSHWKISTVVGSLIEAIEKLSQEIKEKKPESAPQA